ncbi:MAG: MBL fold metallo-hydrolase [Gemmatimonadales bacterium]
MTRSSEESVKIEYIAHASFRLQSSSGSSVLIDPYASRIWLGYDWPEGIEADAILITHPHYDHDAGVFRGRTFPWPDDIPVHREPGVYRVGDIVVHGIEGKHADPYGKEFGQINTIFVLDVAGIRIAHLGDNGPLTAANYAAIGDVDLLMVQVDSKYHIVKPDELERLRRRLHPRWLVPMHYRLPDLESDPDSPKDLGGIEPWLAHQQNVVRLEGNTVRLTASDRRGPAEVLVFRHSPLVKRPKR